MRYVPRGRVRVTAVVAGVVCLAGAGLAYASIPGADGVIHGCYLKSGGNLRVIDSAAKCKTSETSLNWDQKGTTGARGPSGLNGATGPTGPVGPSFGDGTYVNPGGGVGVPAVGCQDNELAKLTVTVTQPSRISANGSGYFYPNVAGNANTASIDVQLRDAGDATTLAETGVMSQFVGGAANGQGQIEAANVLLTAPADTAAYTAAPGTYVLRLVGTPLGQCGVTSQFFFNQLSYVLVGTTP